MSPFCYANKINEPILLIHGEADDNSGTFPIQSERLYMALKGHGATVRYVTLPNEAHGYAARESVLHVIAETVNWFDKYVKNAPGTRRPIDPDSSLRHKSEIGGTILASSPHRRTDFIRDAPDYDCSLRSMTSVRRRADQADRARDAAPRRLGCRRPAALPEVREPAAGGRVQDPRRLQHGRAAHRRPAARAASSPTRPAITARRWRSPRASSARRRSS